MTPENFNIEKPAISMQYAIPGTERHEAWVKS